MPLEIPPPDIGGDKPDEATQKFDFTSASAEGRVLHLDFRFFRYGTNDKVHAAALVLSLLLLIGTFVAFMVGFWAANVEMARSATQWFGGAFLFVAGIALGKAGRERDPPNDDP